MTRKICLRRVLPLLLLCGFSTLVRAQRPGGGDGQQIFATRCAACHGLDGQGAERGPNLASRRQVQQLSDEALQQILREGIASAGMPSFRSLGDAKILAVVRHLRRLQGHEAALPLPGDAERGKVLFSGKAGCAKCHAVNGEGGFLGSDLSSYAIKQSAEEIRSLITDPNKNLDPRERTVVVTSMDGTEIAGIARNEDNFSLQLQSEDGAFHFFTKSEVRNIEHRSKSLMPENYGTRLSRGEIDDVVSYLMKVGRAHPAQKPAKNQD